MTISEATKVIAELKDAEFASGTPLLPLVAREALSVVLERLTNPSLPFTEEEIDEAAKAHARTEFTKPYSKNPEEVICITEPDRYKGFRMGVEWALNTTCVTLPGKILTNDYNNRKYLYTRFGRNFFDMGDKTVVPDECEEGDVVVKIYGKKDE